MNKKYSDCYYCGGIVNEEINTREIKWQEHFFIFENVPMGICNQCGEKYLKPDIVKSIDLLLQKKKKPVKKIAIPVFNFELVAV